MAAEAAPEPRMLGTGDMECGAVVAKGRRGVLLLHGYSFRYTVWVEAGAVSWLVERGLGVAAPDMPYGRSTSCSRRTRDVETNLRVALAAVESAGMREYVVVGASMGARYAVELARRDDHVAGLLLVGPALRGGVEPLPRALPVVVLRGSRDRVVTRRLALEAAERLGGSYVKVDGAGHVVHRDKPGEFIEALAGLLSKALWL